MNNKDQVIRNLQIKNQDLQAELEKLKDELYEAQLRLHGEEHGNDAIIERAKADRRKYEAEIDRLAMLLRDHTIIDITSGDRKFVNAETNTIIADHEISFVRFSLVVYEQGAEDVHIYAGSGYFPGNSQAIQERVVTPLYLQVHQYPTEADIRHNSDFPGISDAEFLDIASRLAHFKKIPTLSQYYEQQRNLIFESYWKKIKAESERLDSAQSKNELSTWFNHRIERLFEKYEIRQQKVVEHMRRITPKR